MSRLKSSLFSALVVTSVLGSACGPQDLTAAYEVALQVDSDCSQTGSSAVQCEVDGEVLDLVRSGRWIVEDKEGGNLINQVSSFILTTDDGRTLPGQHFQNNGTLTDANGEVVETFNCTGQGGRCFVAQTALQVFDSETDCFQAEVRLADFVVDDEGGVTGSIFEQRLSDEACGTRQASQREIKVTGQRAEEVVLAREPGAL